jgi:hypothetical protein
MKSAHCENPALPENFSNNTQIHTFYGTQFSIFIFDFQVFFWGFCQIRLILADFSTLLSVLRC